MDAKVAVAPARYHPEPGMKVNITRNVNSLHVPPEMMLWEFIMSVMPCQMHMA